MFLRRIGNFSWVTPDKLSDLLHSLINQIKQLCLTDYSEEVMVRNQHLDVSSFIEILNYRECSMFWVSHESVVNTHFQMQIRNVNNSGSEMLVMGCEQEQVKLISHLSRNKLFHQS